MLKIFAYFCFGGIMLFFLWHAIPQPNSPTYNKDIASILNENCVSCHRPGEIGPMPLQSYQQVLPFASAIANAVRSGYMPPWHANPNVGKFSNDRRLSKDEVNSIVKWAKNGAVQGTDSRLPITPQYIQGWQIPQPDIEFVMPEAVTIPATGELDYQYMIVATNFSEEKWVTAAEVRPGNREHIHHVIVYVLPPESVQVSSNSPLQQTLGSDCPQADFSALARQRYVDLRSQGRSMMHENGTFLTGWAIGMKNNPLPPGVAIRIPVGARLMFQLHYASNGIPGTDDQTKVGLVFAKDRIDKEMHTVVVINKQFVIPSGNANFEATSCYTFNRDVTLLEMMPHMHLRGKDFTYKVSFPNGRIETILNVTDFDPDWQIIYRLAEPLRLPKGSRIDCIAHFDNSKTNKRNPDHTQEVFWGDQTDDEMMIGYSILTTDLEAPIIFNADE